MAMAVALALALALQLTLALALALQLSLTTSVSLSVTLCRCVDPKKVKNAFDCGQANKFCASCAKVKPKRVSLGCSRKLHLSLTEWKGIQGFLLPWGTPFTPFLSLCPDTITFVLNTSILYEYYVAYTHIYISALIYSYISICEYFVSSVFQSIESALLRWSKTISNWPTYQGGMYHTHTHT